MLADLTSHHETHTERGSCSTCHQPLRLRFKQQVRLCAGYRIKRHASLRVLGTV